MKQTKTKPLISILTGTSEGTMLARLQLKLAASGKVIHRLRVKLKGDISNVRRLELLDELQEARHAARVAQSTIQVPIKEVLT